VNNINIKKINKVLIANRGEIACRIIKACKELKITSVAIYSEVDKNSLHKISADEAYFIGEAQPKSSYLNIDKIIKIAKDNNCDAIHPGYGFLSENEEFNKRVTQEGLIFIGPKSNEVNLLGSKIQSRRIMIENNIPIVPGFEINQTEIDESNLADIQTKVDKIGFPILVKASAGGGGKGMRIVTNQNELLDSINSAKREALSAFADDSIFIEKYIQNPRHIEVQIAADKYGNIIHLFERECSLQRRHQKIIEETPSIALNSELRNQITKTAIEVVKSVNYESIGTVEFIMDSENNFYFLEVNTRIQVEHPITEMVTGVDLLQLQIKIAEGYELPHKQSDIRQLGHSIECRIYAEDSKNNFMPTGGEVLFLSEPIGKNIRIDSGIIKGTQITPFYDPIMSKVIVYAEDREKARVKMVYALKNTVILGIKNSIPFMINLLNSEEFKSGNTFTNTISNNLEKYNKEVIDFNFDSSNELLNSDENQNEIAVILSAIGLTKEYNSNKNNSYSGNLGNSTNAKDNLWISIGPLKFL